MAAAITDDERARLTAEAVRMYGNMRSGFSDEAILVMAGHLIRLASSDFERPESAPPARLNRYQVIDRQEVFEKLDSIRDQIGTLRTNDPLKALFEIVDLLAKS